jgi:hypothetical protein
MMEDEERKKQLVGFHKGCAVRRAPHPTSTFTDEPPRRDDGPRKIRPQKLGDDVFLGSDDFGSCCYIICVAKSIGFQPFGRLWTVSLPIMMMTTTRSLYDVKG